MFDAIYTRQSVDRADSISVESQAERCARETAGRETRLYTDKGYSGKDTDRPALRQLLRDVEAGEVRRVVVYRLDRISRSVLDFANVVDLFQKHGVDFVSTVEKFDTGTPVGKAMLMLVMVFAQLERETIQQRVADAYASRSRRGFYMGGRVPFGFALRETVLGGVRTKQYEPVEPEASAVRRAFALYAQPQASLADVARALAAGGAVRRDGKPFSRSGVRGMMVNPAYVRADARVYAFFLAQGVNLADPPERFTGVHGAYLYSGGGPERKTVSPKGHTLVLAPHEGLVDAGTWLCCRAKCLQNRGGPKPVRARASWLAGKLRCACCGGPLAAKTYHCKTKADNRYFLCANGRAGGCRAASLDAGAVEAAVREELREKLKEFPSLRDPPGGRDPRADHLQIRIEALGREIDSLLDRVPAASGTLMAHLNRRVEALDAEQESLRAALDALAEPPAPGGISGYFSKWESLSVQEKHAAADALIEQITAGGDRLEIRWRL